MMLDGVSHGTVSANGHAGESGPVPQLFEIAGGMRLRVYDGDDETAIVRGLEIINARSLGQIVVQCGGQGFALAVVQLLMANQRCRIQTDAVQCGNKLIAPHAFVLRADKKTDKHAHRTAGCHGNQHAGYGVPGEDDHHCGGGVQNIPSPLDRGAGSARACRSQESRHATIDAGQQSRPEGSGGRDQSQCQRVIMQSTNQYGYGGHHTIAGKHSQGRDRGLQPFPGYQQLRQHDYHDDDGG